jgi:hypothetical protein
MNLGLRDGISLGPVIATALTAGPSPESDENVRRERAIDVINVAKKWLAQWVCPLPSRPSLGGRRLRCTLSVTGNSGNWGSHSGLEKALHTRSVVSGRLETHVYMFVSLFIPNVVLR